MRRNRLSDRVRQLETTETAVVEVGNGPPTHASYPVTLYFDQRNKELYACVAVGGGAQTWKRMT